MLGHRAQGSAKCSKGREESTTRDWIREAQLGARVPRGDLVPEAFFIALLKGGAGTVSEHLAARGHAAPWIVLLTTFPSLTSNPRVAELGWGDGIGHFSDSCRPHTL